MDKFSVSATTLRGLLSGASYYIPYYQRSYTWSRSNIEQMLEDLANEFLDNYQNGDSRTSVSNYKVYFMGNVVLSDGQCGQEGKNGQSLIDGQQRLLSLSLLLIYLNHRIQALGGRNIAVEQMICSEIFGTKTFNLDAGKACNGCLESLYRNDFQPECSTGDLSADNLYARYADIEELFPQTGITNENIFHFTDWVCEKVQMVRIEVADDTEAQSIFVGINDRGKNLTATELLKSFLLSSINDVKVRNFMDQRWKDMVLELKNLQDQGDKSFICAFLRSQYCDTIRKTTKDSTNEDFELVSKAFHSWVCNNQERLGITGSDGAVDFLERLFWFADRYMEILKAQTELDEALPHIYYNAAVGFTWQPQLLLAALEYGDDAETVREKFEIVSRYIDLYIFTRITAGSSVNYSGIKYFIFALTKSIRRRDVTELKRALHQNFVELEKKPLSRLTLNNYNKKFVKSFLARFLDLLERKAGLQSRYDELVSPGSNAFEIEHIIPDHYEWYKESYFDRDDFDCCRNNVGSLLLLRKSLNSSLQDREYRTKLAIYCSSKANLLSASLGQGFLDHIPKLRNFTAENGIVFPSCEDEDFGKFEIAKRSGLYQKLADIIWNLDFLRLDDGSLPEIQPKKRKPGGLLEQCGLKPGDELEFIPDPSVRVTVADDKLVSYGDRKSTLAHLAATLLNTSSKNLKSLRLFSFENEKLEQRRNRLALVP